DNGDMYVDGHKAASDVRDEFVSVTEKLMDELAQCYNVLPQLDINNTIDHRPEGDLKRLFVSSHLSEVIYVWCYCWRYCFCSCWWRHVYIVWRRSKSRLRWHSR